MYYKSLLYSMIGENEQILWRGKPNFKCFILESIFNSTLPFAIVWALVDLFVISTFLSNSSELVGTFSLALIGFFALHLMPVWLYLGGIIFSVLKYKHTEFAVTDKGVYCSGGLFVQTFEFKPFTELSHINIHRGIIDQFLGVGDIVLTSNQSLYGHSTSIPLYKGIIIYDIPDYQKVYNMVKKLQTDVYSDTMYPNDLRPDENNGYRTKYKGLDH